MESGARQKEIRAIRGNIYHVLNPFPRVAKLFEALDKITEKWDVHACYNPTEKVIRTQTVVFLAKSVVVAQLVEHPAVSPMQRSQSKKRWHCSLLEACYNGGFKEN